MQYPTFPQSSQPPVQPQGSLIDDIRQIQAARRRVPAPRGIIGTTPMVVIPKADWVRMKERNALLQVELQLTRKKVASLERDYQDMLDMFGGPWRG
ncbi:MAG: hypothetical protein F4090_04765 [Nitrospira sp. SB0672_bin_25]|nr:hypothetical protein [Nitrospira sp. SB0666_bin_27]MYF24785.1 hypothetical protein [Nitrospira sp. SB0678_bin_10]MYJ54206.1 hypothetical protein [Nitrospira sp. SB0672_bin_25]